MTADKTGTKSTANSNSNTKESTFCTPAVPTPTSFIFSDNEATEFSGMFSDSTPNQPVIKEAGSQGLKNPLLLQKRARAS